MRKRTEIYRCNVCGNITEVLHGGVGTMICCNKPMELLKPKTVEEGKEKHVPVIKKTDEGIKVVVGSVHHPMEENHFIEWIEVIIGENVLRKFLKPGEPPEATFKLLEGSSDFQVREYCTVHGLWSAESN